MVQQLLAAGADVNGADRYGVTPLMAAALGGKRDLVAPILAARANPTAVTRKGTTALHLAAREAVGHLLDAGLDVNAADGHGEVPLHVAADGGHWAVVEQLVAAGADVRAATADGETVLHYAAYRGSAYAVGLLLSAGADVAAATNEGDTALHCATTVEVVRLLLEAGVSASAVDSDGNNVLHSAVSRGNFEVVQEFLASGLCVNTLVPRHY